MNIMMIRVVKFLLPLALLLPSVGAAAETNDELIRDVALEAGAFNPSRGEKVHLIYKLAKSEKVMINIYDADGGLVRTLLDAVARKEGKHKDVWDGHDDERRSVPDEAYTFTIETAMGAVYDPTTFSGGIVGDITEARFDEDGTVVYKLPAPARVLIRLGIHSGPMHKTLVNWKPRVAGTITEYWDGGRRVLFGTDKVASMLMVISMVSTD